MPRDGSGGYDRYTPGTPYVNGTTIDETVVNAEMDDLAAAIADSLAANGEKVPTNNLPMGGYKHTGVGDATAANHYAAAGQITKGALVYASVGGTADAITFTLSPAATAYTTGMRWTAKATAANTGAATGNLNAIGAKDIKRPNGDALQAGDIPNGGIIDLEYDGTNIVLLNPATVKTQTAGDNSTNEASTEYVDRAIGVQLAQIPVRQTVLSGPVDSSGYSAFGGSTGSTTVTMSGTLIAAAANGFSSAGGVNRVGSITNASWTSLSTNGTMYLYLTVNADGTCTTGSSTLAPTYQWGGSYSTASGQFTFNIQEMTGKVGDGASSAQAYRVYVGEVTVAGNVVTAITWYALQGRYESPRTAISIDATTTLSHNLGVMPTSAVWTLVNESAELGYAVDEETSGKTRSAALEDSISNPLIRTRTAVKIRLDGEIYVESQSTTSHAAIDTSKWKQIVRCWRGW